jgi:hypothetical protein
MNSPFTIDVSWPITSSISFLEQTELSIWIAGECATRVEEVLDRNPRHTVLLSAPKLAEWLAGNWWRLRWEPEIPVAPDSDAISDWNMTHNLANAGGGFIWPALWFSSEGEDILVRAEPTVASPAEPIRYLSRFERTIPSDSFEREIDWFVEATIARMDRDSEVAREISDVWAAVLEERQDPGLTEARKLEAMLGCDPAEAPESLIESLLEQAHRYGRDAVGELAAHSKVQALADLDILTGWASSIDTWVQVPNVNYLAQDMQIASRNRQAPWERGERAASIARDNWGLRAGPVSDQTLSDLFATSCLGTSSPSHLPISAGLRNHGEPNRFQACLRQRSGAGRRFALSRLVADHLASQDEDTLLPATEAKTGRQKFQRAFAREFLCPFQELMEFIGPITPGPDEIEYAAEYFQISEWAIRYTLVNKGIIKPERLTEAGNSQP